MEYKDYYKILGVAKGASAKEIKAAYRRLARKHHPDVNPADKQAEARFKEINEANEVLLDPEKRRRYDQLGANWSSFGGGVPGGFRPGGGRVTFNVRGPGGGRVSDFSEFFETFFGGGGFDLDELLRNAGAARPEVDGPGQDLEFGVELSLEEVARGATRTVSPSGGSSRRVEVKIPAGLQDGARVRVAGEGAASGRGNRRGDLYLRVHVKPHPSFARDGDDLKTTVRVPLTTAVLGGEASVSTLDGAVGIKIPAGTPAGRVFRLRGHGLPGLGRGGARGDLLAELALVLPENLSKREREIFEELKKLGR